MNEFSFAQQGWQCPICKRVYSPYTPSCFCCGNEQTITTTTGTITVGSAPNDTALPKGTGDADALLKEKEFIRIHSSTD